jgi:hypothetical protein
MRLANGTAAWLSVLILLVALATPALAGPAPVKASPGGAAEKDPLASLPAGDRVWDKPSGAKPDLQASGVPLDLKQPLDIRKLTLDRYRRVVDAAREAMRLVQGELTPEEARRSAQKWGALAHFPTPEAVDYLNRLNPLLVEFLTLRGLIADTGEEFDAAWAEGTLAAGYGNAAGAEEAFAVAGQQKVLLQSLNARLAALAGKIEALGNPPDVLEAKGRAKKRHAEAVKTVRKLARAGKEKPGGKPLPAIKRSGKIRITPSAEVALGGSFIEFEAQVPPDIAARATTYYWQFWGANPSGGNGQYTKSTRMLAFVHHSSGEFDSGSGMMMVNVEAQQVKGRAIASGRVYVPFRRIEIQDLKVPAPYTGTRHFDAGYRTHQSFDMRHPLPVEHPKPGTNRVRITGQASLMFRIENLKAAERDHRLQSIQGICGVAAGRHTVTRETRPLDMGAFRGQACERTIRPPRNDYGHASDTMGRALLPLAAAVPAGYQGPLDYVYVEYEAKAQCDNCYEQGSDYSGLTEKRARDLLQKIHETLAAARVGPQGEAAAAAGPEEEEEPEDPAARQETIAFHESNIAILQKNLQREEEDLAREKDPGRREALAFRVRTLKADVQAERDLIQSIRTGEIVHTRTEFDDYLRDQFVASIRTNQIRMEVARRQAAEAQRIGALLPPGEAEEARKFIDRQLTPEVLAKGDVEKAGQVIEALSGKVRGYAEGARARQETAEAERALMVLGGIQQAGNIAVTFVGGKTAAAAYAGLTGYITGGPVDAVRGAASWYSTAGYLAVEAWDGYAQGGHLAGPGVGGAIEKGATALAMGKLFEYGIQRVGAATGILSQPATREELKKRLADFRRQEMLRERLRDFRLAEARRAGGPGFDVPRFREDMTRGKQLVDDFAQIEQRIAAAKRFGAEPGTRRELESLAVAKSKEINASFHAKNYLKAAGGDIEKAATGRIEGVYREVDARFKQILAEEHKWDMKYLKFKEFRNASSRGKIGMDRDFGLVEDEVTLLVKGGKQSSIHQMQKDGQAAYKKAYEEITGQSYEKSFQEFTTRAHSESFRDLGVLKDLRNPKNVANLERMWGEQTARTIEYKGLHMLGDPKLNPHLTLLDRHLEASRGLAKELDKKVIPFLQNAKTAPGLDPAKIRETERHFREVKQVLEDFSSYRIDPATASERLRLATGGKDLPQVLDQVRNVTEALFKFGALGK